MRAICLNFFLIALAATLSSCTTTPKEVPVAACVDYRVPAGTYNVRPYVDYPVDDDTAIGAAIWKRENELNSKANIDTLKSAKSRFEIK